MQKMIGCFATDCKHGSYVWFCAYLVLIIYGRFYYVFRAFLIAGFVQREPKRSDDIILWQRIKVLSTCYSDKQCTDRPGVLIASAVSVFFCLVLQDIHVHFVHILILTYNFKGKCWFAHLQIFATFRFRKK